MSTRGSRCAMPARGRTGRQSGMALVVVLWLIVLVGMMAAGHARNTRTETLLASRQADLAAARALAEAGIHHVMLEMLATDRLRARPVDGSRLPVDVAGERVHVAVRDMAGLVDLNRAGADMLDAALAACGLSDRRRAELVASILDWRDRDSTPHTGGVEDEDYRAADLPWSARDNPFESVEELRYVLGMDPDLYACMAPLVTVRSSRPNVNIAYAPPPLQRAMADRGIAYAPPRRSTGSGVYQFVATAEGRRGAVASVEAVIRLTRNARDPYQVLEWREPARALPDTGKTPP